MVNFLCMVVLASPIKVFLTDDMQRLPPTVGATAPTIVGISAAKGETASFQMVVEASGANLTGTKVTLSELKGPNGARIPKENLVLYREHFVSIGTGSLDPNRYPPASNYPIRTSPVADALIPLVDPETGLPPTSARFVAQPFNLQKGQAQPIFVDVKVPYSASPGAYTGKYTVTCAQGTATNTFKVTVWGFAVPKMPKEDSCFVSWTELNLPTEKLLLENRAVVRNTLAANAPVLANEYGLDLAYLNFWSGANVGNPVMVHAPSEATVMARASALPPGFRLINYSADEIGGHPELYQSIKDWAKVLHIAGARQLITMPPDDALLVGDDGKPAVDIWCMVPKQFTPAALAIENAKAKGCDIWMYTALVQDGYSPKWQVDYSPANFRAHGLINQYMGITGILYWRIDRYGPDAWVDPVYHSGNGFSYPGEGLLIYPGADCGTTGPVPSLRLKWIRNGMYDYDYVALLREKGYGTWALEQTGAVAKDFWHWSQTGSSYLNVRTVLGLKLDALSRL